ncbi:MAG: NUDIX domain-containing protein [Candidatus Aenigmarchaeota archaeon]|nr:NUDIX domain-containing protein [Candidatus Aenigmarchaeota archaeon]
MPRALTVDGIVIEEGRILLIRRGSPPFRGYYALPGGHIEKNEDVIQALVREVREETGLVVEPGMPVGIYDDPKRDKRGNVTIAFLCSIKDGEPSAGSDSCGVRFFPLDRLPSRMAFDHREMIRDAAGLLGTKKAPKKVLAGGAFNLVHPGHIHFLERARELGDELVVVVASDKTVLKAGKQLLFPAGIRARMVGSIGFVSKAVIGDERDMLKVVRAERPDVIAMGYDQDVRGMKAQLNSAGITCKVVRVGKLKGYSTKRITGG